MKKVLFFTALMSFGVATMFTSCSKDESGPSIEGTWEQVTTSTNGGTGYTHTRTVTTTLTLKAGGMGDMVVQTIRTSNPTNSSDGSDMDTYEITEWYTMPENLIVISMKDKSDIYNNIETDTYEYSLTNKNLALDGRVFVRK